MSYTKTTNFSVKDSLPSGDANKIVKGTEINTEFNNIETAISTLTSTIGGLSTPSGLFNSVSSVSAGAMMTTSTSYSSYQTAPNPGFVVVWNINGTDAGKPQNQADLAIGIAMNGGQDRAYNPGSSNAYSQWIKVGFGTN